MKKNALDIQHNCKDGFRLGFDVENSHAQLEQGVDTTEITISELSTRVEILDVKASANANCVFDLDFKVDGIYQDVIGNVTGMSKEAIDSRIVKRTLKLNSTNIQKLLERLSISL